MQMFPAKVIVADILHIKGCFNFEAAFYILWRGYLI